MPNDDAALLARKGTAKMAWRVAKRSLEVWASGQADREAERWDPAWKRAIWLHAEAPQIGDALLDLAPRSLLVEHGIAVDAMLPPPLYAAFVGDRYFGRVFAQAEAFDADAYDVAVVDSRCWKSLAWKRSLAPRLPWLAVRGDYLAYDFQRGLLATRRFAEWLGLELAAADELRHARQKLEPRDDAGPDARAAGRIAITVGGVRPERTYRSWPEVARRLVAEGRTRLVLLGSDNGATFAREVKAILDGSPADVLDLVGKTDIAGTQRAMRGAGLVVCVDGGLMHLACTTATPMVALFDATSLPVWRVPVDYAGTALVSPSADVNGLDAERVATAVLARLA